MGVGEEQCWRLNLQNKTELKLKWILSNIYQNLNCGWTYIFRPKVKQLTLEVDEYEIFQQNCLRGQTCATLVVVVVLWVIGYIHFGKYIQGLLSFLRPSCSLRALPGHRGLGPV